MTRTLAGIPCRYDGAEYVGHDGDAHVLAGDAITGAYACLAAGPISSPDAVSVVGLGSTIDEAVQDALLRLLGVVVGRAWR